MTTRKQTGAILYEGPSQIDGAPIVVIVTGLASSSANSKTGNMLQTWILRTDVEPHVAAKNGQDESICGDCVHRANPETGTRSCYVRVFQAPLSVFKAYKRGNYPKLHEGELERIGANRKVRLGSYGDPMAAPIWVWREFTRKAASHTGYTHQWRKAGAQSSVWAQLCMASADSVADHETATKAGWRTFRVMPKGAKHMPKLEVLCPASKEAGVKTTCEACQLCKGTASKARKSVAINLH